MFRKIHWSIPLLAVLFIAVGGFVYWQWSSVQQLKDEIAQDKKSLQENDKPIAEDKQPTTKLVQHDDHFHEVSMDTNDEINEFIGVSSKKGFTSIETSNVDNQYKTNIEMAQTEDILLKLKNPDMHKDWVEWSKKHDELAEQFSQVTREMLDVLPSTREDKKLFDNDPKWQHQYSEVLKKSGRISAMMKDHDDKNPLFK